MECEMRSMTVRAKLINDTMVVSLHNIVCMKNFGTHIQCSCGAIVRLDDWGRHISEIVIAGSEKIETE